MRSLPLVLLLLLPVACAHGQDEEEAVVDTLPIGMDVRLGFSEKIPPVGFTPVFVDLHARERDHTGVVITFRAGDTTAPLLSLGPVNLTAGQTRRVRGIAPAKSWLVTGALVARAELAGGEVLGESQVYPDTSSDRLLLILDRHGAAPADFSLLQTTTVDSKQKTRYLPWTTAILSSIDDLPISQLGYSGASAILLGDLELERWSEAQASALAGWVARGGHLMITIGSRGALLRKSLIGKRLGEGLAPIPHDSRPILGSEVNLETALANFGPTAELETTRPPYSATLRPSDSERVLLRDDTQPRGRPFVVLREHGLGLVTLIGADLWSPPFLHAEHTRGLVEYLVRNGGRYSSRSRYLFHELAAVRQPAQVGPAFAVLILYALIAGPGVYFLLRAKKRAILLWIAIPALTLAFTALVPFYRLVLKDAESTLVGVRLIEMESERTTAVETADALIFSGSLESKHLSLKGVDAIAHAVIPPRRMRQRGSPRLGKVLGTAGPGGLDFDLPVALWGTRYVSFARTWEAPPISGSVEISAGGFGQTETGIEIEYGGRYPLLDAIVIYPNRRGPLIHEIDGELRSGAHYTKTIGSVLIAGTYESSQKSLGGLMITRLIREPYRNLVDAGQGAYLIGWTQAPFPVDATPNVRTRASATLMAIRLPVRYRDGLPFGAANPFLESSTIAVVNTSTVTREIKVQFDLPGSRSQEVNKLEVRLNALRGTVLGQGGIALEGVYHGPEGSSLRRAILLTSGEIDRSDSGRRVTIRLPDPQRWISPDGELIIYQRFDRPRMEEDRNYSASIDVAARWERAPPK